MKDKLLSLSLRAKLLLLLLVVFAPNFALVMSSGIRQRNADIEEAKNRAYLLTESLAAQQEQVVATARTMLTMLADRPEVRNLDGDSCGLLLSNLQKRYPFFRMVLVASPDGKVIASSLPSAEGLKLANRKFVRDALRSLDFSTGEYSADGISYPSLHFAYPVLGGGRNPIALVIADFDPAEYQRFVSKLVLPDGYVILITDWNGVRLFRSPQNPRAPVGEPILPQPFSLISGPEREGFREWQARDGDERIYAFRQMRLRDNAAPYLYFLVGVPKQRILRHADLQMLGNLGILGVATTLAMVLAWTFGNAILVGPIGRLVIATDRFRAGDLHARTELPHNLDEIGRLAKSFDTLAALLEKRHADQEAAEESLHRANSELQRHQERLEHDVIMRTLELRRIVDTAQEGIWALDLDASTTYANSRMAEMLGCSAEQMLGRSLYEYVHESERATLLERMKQHREGASGQYESRLRGKDNRDIWVRISASPLIDASANLTGTLALVADITPQVRAQAQLRLQSAALTATANAIVITDRSGTIQWVNPAFTELTGYSQAEVLGQNTRILKSGKQNPELYRRLWQTVLSGSEWRGELINRRKNGCLYVEETAITPVRSDSGEISHFIAVKVDVSERRQAQEALAQSEANLRSLVQDAPFGVFRSTPEGKILNANPALCSMLGYDSEAELMSIDINSVYHRPEERIRVLEALQKERQLNGVESAWNTKDGSRIDVRLHLHTSRDASGSPVFEGFVEDVTERKRSQLELQRLNRALTTLGRCNEAVVHATDETELLQKICETLIQVGSYRLAWVGYAEEDANRSVRPVAQSGEDNGYIGGANISWSEWNRDNSPTGTAIRTGKLTVLRNVEQDPQFAPCRRAALQRGYASIVALPLREASRTFGALTICACEPGRFDGEEIQLLEELAADLSYGIASLRSEANRRKAEIELRESEQRYRLLFACNPHPMWVSDLQTRGFVEVNDAAITRYGYSREEFLAMKMDDIRPAEEIPAFLKILSTAKEGYTFSGSSRHRTKDGSILDVEIAAYRFVQDGKMLSLTLANDVTERKRAEQALARSEQRYRTLFEHNLAAVFHSSPQKLLDCNEAMCQMLGYSHAELIALDLREIYCDLASREAGLRQLYSNGKLTNYQVDLRRKDGGVITVLANLNLLVEDAGAPTLAGVMLDITEVQKLQDQLLQSRKLEAIGKFSGGIAHDFNNILMIINSYSEIVSTKLATNDPLHRQIDQIRGAVNRAAALTRQLLAFSRKQTMAPVPVRLDSVLQGLKDMMKRLIGEDISLEVAGPEDLWLTMVDPSQVEQAVLNLAANARDAMPDGGQLTLRTANVVLNAEFERTHPGSRAGEYVALYVSDTGCGIDSETQARIFEPFFTTKAAGNGTGLGLATVYGIVKQSDGYIGVESDIGAGTTFSIYLPRTLEPAAIEIGHGESSPTRSSATILLVEDEDPTREAIAEYLQENGFQVVSAANAQEALRIARLRAPRSFDVLLTDVIMPGMKGSDLATTFRSENPKARVVFMSGYTDEVLVKSGLDLRYVTVLAKPFRLFDLAEKLRGLFAPSSES